MILFETDSQWREKAMIWRLFAMLPLSSFLLNDHIVRWFAVNIPMSLVQGGGHGELDIIAKLKYPPRSKDTWFYRTWEVKVSLLCNDGTAKSLKAGKLPDVLTQMRNYRRFGASSVTLLDLYLCQVGTIDSGGFFSDPLQDLIKEKRAQLAEEGYGYQVIPFEHHQRDGGDYGLRVIEFEHRSAPGYRPVTSWAGAVSANTFLTSEATAAEGHFATLVAKVDAFYEGSDSKEGSLRQQITFCETCRNLQLIRMREQSSCPSCGRPFIGERDFDNCVRLPSFRANDQPPHLSD